MPRAGAGQNLAMPGGRSLLAGVRTARRRCSECRKWFAPHPASTVSQKTCGAEACRRSRRGKLARRRRAADLEGARQEERERQRAHRARVRAGADRKTSSCHAPGSGGRPCHGPASGTKGRESRREFEILVDRVMSASRATLEREIGVIFEAYAPKRGTRGCASPACHAPAYPGNPP